MQWNAAECQEYLKGDGKLIKLPLIEHESLLSKDIY